MPFHGSFEKGGENHNFIPRTRLDTLGLNDFAQTTEIKDVFSELIRWQVAYLLHLHIIYRDFALHRLRIFRQVTYPLLLLVLQLLLICLPHFLRARHASEFALHVA